MLTYELSEPEEKPSKEKKSQAKSQAGMPQTGVLRTGAPRRTNLDLRSADQLGRQTVTSDASPTAFSVDGADVRVGQLLV